MPPTWVGPKQKDLWNKPWTVEPVPGKHKAFKDLLWSHGYISPHFTREEAKSGDGVALPGKYQDNAQIHGFRLERVRHRLSRPLIPIDWYRSPAHNADVGGVPNSQHLYADATDWGTQPNQSEFNSTMRDVFEHGGIGSGGSSGNVQHVDDGPARRWSYPGR